MPFKCDDWDCWKSGDEDDVVDGDGVGVGGGAVGPADHVCTLSNGLRKLVVSPLGNDPYARNIFFINWCLR